MMSQDKHRYVVGRLVPPPSLPGLVPGPLTAAKHLAAHDVGADILDDVVENLGVDGARAAGFPVLLPPAGGFEHPLVQAHPAFADRVLEALVGTGNEAIERDRDLTRD